MQVTRYTSSHFIRHADRGSCEFSKLMNASLLELAEYLLVLRHVLCLLFYMHRGHATAIRLTLWTVSWNVWNALLSPVCETR